MELTMFMRMNQYVPFQEQRMQLEGAENLGRSEQKTDRAEGG
jgi:hypothetical protein